MPVFAYKAVTESGLVVKNKIEETNKHAVVQRLKRNNLMPISIVPVRGLILNSKKQKKERKNVTDISQIMKNVNTANIMNQDTKKFTLKEKIMISLNANQKVTTRDLLIFTENFYLLKKANFNNIHALNTIIQSTENWTFKGILEDILSGLEAGENMYTTMEYYSNVFPYIYINTANTKYIAIFTLLFNLSSPVLSASFLAQSELMLLMSAPLFFFPISF